MIVLPLAFASFLLACRLGYLIVVFYILGKVLLFYGLLSSENYIALDLPHAYLLDSPKNF